MRQPRVKLFGKIYNVLRIEWNNETGEKDHILYFQAPGQRNFIYKYDKINYGHELRDLTKPIAHPFDGHIGVSSFEEVLI